ncbi:MAG: hypothetical protein ACFBSG_17820 [Leptolyngbyaceae cyanobacterium]
MHSYTEKSARLEQHRRQLEALVNPPIETTAYHPNRLGQLINRMGKSLVNWLTASPAPQVSKQIQGDVEVWRVYDPISNRTAFFDDEASLRVWMENRYNQ